MGGNNLFSKIIAHLNVLGQQTAQTSAFMQLVKLADDQLIKGV